jgi:pyruvate,water dikinase
MHTLPFTSPHASLLTAGGKGANLARLAQAGFPVPAGFIIATDAYRQYVTANQLANAIQPALDSIQEGDAATLEAAAASIRSAFTAGEMPVAIKAEILAAHTRLAASLAEHITQPDAPLPLAVRSSATAEDLPDLSFAGQQDTFLNVIGEEQLLKAVVNCWSSLWTGRAIGYRLRNQVDHGNAALAVVVQRLVPSQVSGVLFTANPLSGLRSETVIDAVFGLGEALVSGQVEPDQFVVDTRRGAVVSRKLGAKAATTRSQAGGGVQTISENASQRQTLSDQQLLQLAELGQRVQAEYAAPQDIEWAYAGGELYLLQSRPITSLFPIPEESFDPLTVWMSFGAVQGLVGPLTPLGQDGIRSVLAGFSASLGSPMTVESNHVFVPAGERIWIKFSDAMRNPIGLRVLRAFIGLVEPGSVKTIETLLNDPRLGAGEGKVKLSTLRRMIRFGLPILPRLAKALLFPERARQRFEQQIAATLAAAKIEPGADRFERLANTLAFIRVNVANAFPFLLPRFIPLFGPSMLGLNLLARFAPPASNLALETTRSLPDNVTTQMDLALWRAAVQIRQDTAAKRVFQSNDAAALAQAYLSRALPPAAQSALDDFLQRYGVRGVGEIDLGQPRWRDDPTPVMHSLKSYLEIDPQSAPAAVFARGEQSAQAAIQTISAHAQRQHGGWLKGKIVRSAARRVRTLMGVRESPKFYAVRLMGIAHQALLDVGREFVQAGAIEHPDDLFFLHLSELDALSRQEAHEWKTPVAARRSAYQREQRRRMVPRLLVSDGRAFYDGVGAATDSGSTITGSPVSPGVVEGAVRVVLDPRRTQLLPGEILVCPGTDPAWTPLFMAAAGLVTEVGGMMTHGSVVAREYGIPAVVGVHQATLRLKDGMRIRLDGSRGVITRLE